MRSPKRRDHAGAVLATLESVGLTVEEGKAPNVAPPYAFIAAAFVELEGPMNAPHDDGRMAYRINTAGTGPEQAAHWGDVVQAVMLDPESILRTLLAAEGRTVAHVSLQSASGPLRDPDTQPSLWFCSDVFEILSTPGEEGS